jgi:hypothetical protein
MPGGVMSRPYYCSKNQQHFESKLPATLSCRIHYASNDEMKIILIAVLLIATSSLTYAQTDRDIDNDGQWDE